METHHDAFTIPREAWGDEKARRRSKGCLRPFEDVIWQEIKQVEAALRKAITSEDTSRDGDAIFALAVTRAHHSIGYGRYGDNRSVEHVSAVTFWIAHLAPLTATR